MSRRKSSVTQSDLTRWIKAVRAAGVEDFRVEIEQPDGVRVSIVANDLPCLTDGENDIDAMIERL